MSKTGRYIYHNGEIVKVSDEAQLPKSTYFPGKGTMNGYFDKGLQKFFYTKEEKRQYLKENNMIETGQVGKEVIKKNTDLINHTRIQGGMKPKTAAQYMGKEA